MSIPNNVLRTMEKAIGQYKGDNLYRAQMAFRNLTEKQLDEEYGESDATPRKMLEGYQNHENECNEAMKWLKSQ